MIDEHAAAFAQLGAATLGESGGQPMAPRIKAAWHGARISAPAFPVTCAAGDNLAIHVAVAEAPAGHVLVASVGIEPERGYWGEVLTTGAEARGIVGLVIDGGVRDVERARSARVPGVLVDDRVPRRDEGAPGPDRWPVDRRRRARARRRLDRRRRRRRHRRPARRLADVLAAGQAREAKEAKFFEELRAGRTTVELLGLDTKPITRD